MSEERFNRIEAQIVGVNQRIDARFAKIDERFDAVDKRFDAVDRRFDAIVGRFGDVDGRIDELRTHMGVLHEDTLARIAAISEQPLATKTDIDNVVTKIDALIERRIVPLEVAVRSLSRTRTPRRRG